MLFGPSLTLMLPKIKPLNRGPLLFNFKECCLNGT